MRTAPLLFGLLFLGTPCAFAQQPAPLINPTAGGAVNAGTDILPELPANTTVDQVLDALDQRGKSLREFTAKVSMTSGVAIEGDLSTRVGQIMFQKKGDDDGRLRLKFDKRVDSRHTHNESVEYLLDNGILIDRDYHKKEETDRQIIKPGGKMNLLKLGEGPFPLPIGQNKEDVHKLFDVTLIAPGKDDAADLAGTIHIKLTPKEGTKFFRRFNAIDVWVSRKSSFPIRIDTAARDGSDPHTTRLEEVKINPQPGLREGDFTLPMIDRNVWNLRTEPYRE